MEKEFQFYKVIFHTFQALKQLEILTNIKCVLNFKVLIPFIKMIFNVIFLILIK